MEEFLEKLYASDDDLSKTVLDILRVLVAFNGVIWRSEIERSIMKVRRGYIDYVPTPDIIDEALKELERRGIISLEKRKRGDMLGGGVVDDVYVKLEEKEVIRLLLRDEVLREYRQLVYEEIKKSLERDFS